MSSKLLSSPLQLIVTAALLAGLAAGPARAAEPAWYHPDEVAGASAVFQQAAGEIAPRYQALEDDLRRLSRPLEDLELATALAGDRLSPDSRAYAETTRRAAAVAHLQAQRHVDLVQEDYARVFGAALQRALSEVGKGYTVKECSGGGGVQAMMGRSRSCEGKDLNAALARAIDQDAQLQAEVAEINAVPWPEVEIQGAEQPVVPLTGSGGWFSLATVARSLWSSRLVDRSDDLDRELAPIDDEIEAGEASALARAQEARAGYESALAADGEVLLALLQEALAKKAKKGGDDLGACINPVELGGCPGPDRTAEVLGLVGADRRLRKGLDALPR